MTPPEMMTEPAPRARRGQLEQQTPRAATPSRFRRRWPRSVLACLAALAAGLGLACASGGVGPNADKPLETVDSVDLNRFAGLWYVISSMPTPAEEGAHNSTEQYRLRADGDIEIVNRFRVGGFDGPEEIIRLRGWVYDTETRAEWRVQPFWPVRLSYLILELADDYSYCVIGHPSKNYVWIMARSPDLSPTIQRGVERRLRDAGYDVRRLIPMPQQPLDQRPSIPALSASAPVGR